MDTVARLMPGHRAFWLTFYAAILVAWAILFAMQAGGLRETTDWQLTGLPMGQPLEAFLSLCSATAATAGFGVAALSAGDAACCCRCCRCCWCSGEEEEENEGGGFCVGGGRRMGAERLRWEERGERGELPPPCRLWFL